MKFDLSHIEFSHKDKLRNITLPDELTPELAEFIGIMVGDGHLGHYFKPKLKVISSEIKIACNSNEKEYICHVCSLFNTLFNFSLTVCKDKRSDTVLLAAYSRCVVQFFVQLCDIPVNNKVSSVRIPIILKNGSRDIQCSFLKGLADTDFSVVFRHRKGRGYVYPVIKAGFKSKYLIEDLEKMFFELGFSFCSSYDVIRHDKRFRDTILNIIYLNGTKNFEKWFKIIGFSNPKFQRKAEKWLKEGFCPPGY